MYFVAREFDLRLTNQVTCGPDTVPFANQNRKRLRMSPQAEAELRELSLFLREKASEATQVTKQFFAGNLAELYRRCLRSALR